MPKLPNLLYRQLSYHKILPLVCNLSMKIFQGISVLVRRVLDDRPRSPQNFPVAIHRSRLFIA